MTTVANLLVQISADTAQLRSGLRSAETQLDRFTGSIDNIGNRIKSFGGNLGQITAPLQDLGVAGLAVASSFENVVTQLATFGGLAGDELEAVRQKALQLGEDTMFSATDAGLAMLELAKSGFSVQESMTAADGALQLAAVGAMSMEQAAGIVSTTLAQFGLEAADAGLAVDLLARAASASRANVDGLAMGLSNVGPVAAQFGLSLEDTAAALAVFSNAGIDGAEAGTQLKSMLLSLATSDVAAGAMERLGLSFDGVINGSQTLDGFLDDLAISLADLPAEEQAVVLKDLAGAYGITGLSALLAAGGTDQMVASMEGAPSAADIASASMDTFSGKIESLKGSVETLAINAMTPLMDSLGELATSVTPIINDISAWAQANPELARTITAIGAGLVVATPLVIAIGTAMTLAAPAVGLLGSAIGLALGPVGLLAVALLALGRVVTDPAIQDGLSAWAGVWDNFKLIIEALPDWITAKMNEVAVSVRNGMRDVNQGILEAMGTLAASGDLVGVDLGANAIAEQLAGSLQAENIESQIAAYLNGQALTIDTSGMNFLVGEGANAAPEEMVNSFLGSLTDPVALQSAIDQAIGTGDAGALEVLLPLSLKTAEDPALQMQELLTTALQFGGESGVGFNVLLPIAQELDVDVVSVIEQFNTSLTDATAAPYDVTMTANVTVIAGSVDVSNVNAAVASALPGGASVSSGGGGGGIVPALATGGYINSEGLAYLHAGEVVLNRDQQAAYGGGGRNMTVNVSNYGNTMFEVLEITRKAARREDF
jgi:TP901 family phage tail tape measure protein